jgi:predicted glutamine amidotransferase
MCIAILNQNNELSFETIENSWYNNPQGAGMLYTDKNINTLRSYKSFDLYDFYRNYLEVLDEAKNGTVILHFRIATQGVKGYDNLHPFINQKANLGFVHNGIISQFVNHKSPKSDTAIFNDRIVSFLDETFIDDNQRQYTMAEFVRSYNKLIFMNNFGDTCIINEKEGIWEGNNWYSNDSYCTANMYYGHHKL